MHGDRMTTAEREATRARLRLVAYERQINPAELAPALSLRDKPLIAFIRRHGLSFDWVLLGDLKGLQRQVRQCA